MEWYRRYHGTNRDPKFEKVSRRTNLPRPYVLAAWDSVCEFASSHSDRGSLFGFDSEHVSIDIGCTIEEAESLIHAFAELGMIKDGRCTNFAKRNPGWDNAAERMRNMRERRSEQRSDVLRNSSARTEQNRTDKNTPKPPRRSADAEPPEFVSFYQSYPRHEARGAARKAWPGAVAKAEPEVVMAGLQRAKAQWDRDQTPVGYIPLPSTWLNQERWSDEHSGLPKMGVNGARPPPAGDVPRHNQPGRNVQHVSIDELYAPRQS